MHGDAGRELHGGDHRRVLGDAVTR
jgi:hypothetical protein